MSQNHVGQRPGYITLIVVLTVISGLASVLSGLVLIFTRNSREVEQAAKASASTVLVIGVITLVIGLIYLAVARGLARGNNGSRVLVIVVSVVNLAAAVWAFTQSTGQGRTTAVVTAIVALVVIGLLSTARSQAFFGRS